VRQPAVTSKIEDERVDGMAYIAEGAEPFNALWGLNSMPRVWFTADLHLGHANIIRYCLRPFLTPEEQEQARRDPRGPWKVSDETVRRHDNTLIDAINAAVKKDDTLWILGDFCWGRGDLARSYRKRIGCAKVHLVWGNHDHPSIRPLFGEVLEQGMITVEDQDIWLNHYPLRSWDRCFHGSWSLYGHVHNRLAIEDQTNPHWLTKDVGVDACQFRPLSFDELRDYMTPRVEAFRQWKNGLQEAETGETG
jgi:calcineurin-like phosphoesterase family protein